MLATVAHALLRAPSPLLGTLALTLTTMSQAAPYTAEKREISGLETIHLTDSAHHIEVSIAPSVGNIAYDMRVNGHQILMSPADIAAWKSNPGWAGIPFLAPWANRLDPDSFWANGREYKLNPAAVNLPRDPNGLAIHGLVLYANDWKVTAVQATNEAAEYTARLEFWRHPEWMSQFPFAHTVDMTYRLSRGTLEVRTTIYNESRDPMPLVIGFHPWYQLATPRDQWTVHLPVREHYTLSNKLIPTGNTTPTNLPDPTPLAGRHLDDVFGGVNHADEFWVESHGQRISVRFGPNFPIAVVYAPKDRNVVCFEPMTGITNGFNLAHEGKYKGLQSIPARATWRESFWIRPTGF
jgi:aldose 1-epimerase